MNRLIVMLVAALGSGLYDAVGGMMVIELLAGKMRLDRGGIAAGEMREWKIRYIFFRNGWGGTMITPPGLNVEDDCACAG